MNMSNSINAGQYREFIINGITFGVRSVLPGRFIMGSPLHESYRYYNECQHEVIITKAFWMMETPVTQKLYKAVMGINPSRFTCDEYNPVELISWHDSVEFCKIISNLTGQLWDLPTEAEWEYSCRAGSDTAFHYGNVLNSSMANFDGEYPYGTSKKGLYRGKAVPVKSFMPNNWGLYDMHGNVWEWCRDYYGDYDDGPVEDPAGPMNGSKRVLRGGSWYLHGQFLRSAFRGTAPPDSRHYGGLRVVLRIPE